LTCCSEIGYGDKSVFNPGPTYLWIWRCRFISKTGTSTI